MKIKKVVSKRTNQLLALLAVVVLSAGFLLTPLVRADIFDQQINALNSDNTAKYQAKSQLGAEAASLTDTIAKLQNQINAVQAQINANQAKRDDLAKQIAAAQAELVKQKALLGEDIRQMYLDGQITTLEMLASSNNLSDFVDKQQYLSTVQNKIKTAVDTITELKHELHVKKTEVDQLLKDEQAMQSQLDSQKAEQDQLLSLNLSQQTSLNNQIQANFAQIENLRQQQIIANARFIGDAGNGPACGGGYPAKWCEIPQDSVIDNWGMYNRECVSYTAFRVAASGRHMPYWGGVGNANQWDDDARASGIPVDSNPRPGDVAISNAGAFGHAMYVEAVNNNGTIFISQYNAALNGTFSTNTISPGGLVFIHFP
ncbi:MAG TPA: CHAP domain-containing protein [Candidatus Saccharimonadales bacterium]|nr:CHAP domain-containing protein [Candidatus Saccharimonadales bacterium]